MSSAMSEINDFHPIVAGWLSDNGYKYEHEVAMPEYGKADFVATSQEGRVLIVEAKLDCTSIGKAIVQVRDYRDQYAPAGYAAVAVPATTTTERARSLCARRCVLLIEVEVPSDLLVRSTSTNKYGSEEFMRLSQLLQKMGPAMNKAYMEGSSLNAAFDVLNLEELLEFDRFLYINHWYSK